MPVVFPLLEFQHYMLNSSVNDQLSIIAGVVEGDVVLEIGPGTGSLTNVLINAGAAVIAVEKVGFLLFFSLFFDVFHCVVGLIGHPLVDLGLAVSYSFGFLIESQLYDLMLIVLEFLFMFFF